MDWVLLGKILAFGGFLSYFIMKSVGGGFKRFGTIKTILLWLLGSFIISILFSFLLNFILVLGGL